MGSTIRAVLLTPETIRRNKIDKNQAITMGIKEIMESRVAIFMASSKEKAEAVKRTVEEEPSSRTPASFLQLHRKAYTILDRDAASLLG